MISRIQLTTVVYVIAAAWAVVLLFQGVAVPSVWFQPLSWVIGLLAILLWVFDRWAWRLFFLHPWFVDRPNIHGTWQGVLSSTWPDPTTSRRLDPLLTYIVIRQTFSSIHVRLLTKESSSDSLTADLVKATDGTWSLVTVYHNIPSALIVDRSPQHFGAVVFTMRGQHPGVLNGQYWTNRNTKGDLRFTARSKRLFGDYASARAAIPHDPHI